MSLESFAFRNPVKIIFGKDAIEKIGVAIKNSGIKKVLVVFGSGSSKVLFFLSVILYFAKTNGVYDRVKATLTNNGIEWIELWGVQPNPLVAKVREGTNIIKDKSNGIDGLLLLMCEL
jgi:alcohol dehydrogenase YqhD (iron-dependent ADH family)